VRGPDARSPDQRHILGLGVVERGGHKAAALQLFDGPPWRAAATIDTDDGAWWIDDDRLLVAHHDPAG
jgi:hypothetical protein